MAATQSLSTEIGSKPACDAFGLARSGCYRGQGPATAPAPRPSPPRTLSPEERSVVLATLHSDRFVDTAPAAVYATLLDEGRYPCSIRTLTASSMSRQRSRSAGTNSATRSIRSRNSWRPPRIRCGRGTSVRHAGEAGDTPTSLAGCRPAAGMLPRSGRTPSGRGLHSSARGRRRGGISRAA
jgi:hypothetical protein